MAKRLTLLALLLSFGIGILAQPAMSFPAMKGVVSDYAGKLDEAQIKELSGLLADYERRTSIEFVVVVVNSLDGLSARNYATGIGDSWKIGKAGRDNGIVLLWAPNERAYALRVAEGLSADLPDSAATQITQQNLLPNFKRGDFYAGLKETVLATIQHLGFTTWEARLQARQPDAEQETLDRKRRAEQAWQAEVQRREQARKLESDTPIGFVFFVALAVGSLFAFFIIHLHRRKTKLAEIAQAVTTIADNLSAAETNAQEVQRVLDDCAREMPEQDISKLRESLAGQPERILKIKVDAECIDPAKLESYDDMVRVRANSEAERNLLDSTKESIVGIKNAKAQSQAMLAKLSRETFEITDVRDSSRTDDVNRLLLEGRQNYEQARQGSSMSVFDWLIINQMLTNSQSRIRQAVSCSQEAPYAPSFSSLDDGSSSRRSSSSDSWFGGSGSSSSSSGGGGSFSSGSGSDGTY